MPIVGPAIAAGTLAAIISSAAVGAAVGGLGGTLIGMGIPEEEAEILRVGISPGRYVVTVHPQGREAEVRQVFQDHHAADYANRADAGGTASPITSVVILGMLGPRFKSGVRRRDRVACGNHGGGSGTRFWPESRRARPKQFLQFAGERTLIQATLDRCPGSFRRRDCGSSPIRRTPRETARQLPDVPPEQILSEPCGRNTAPCIGWAALELLAVDHDPLMLVCRPITSFPRTNNSSKPWKRPRTSWPRNLKRCVLFGINRHTRRPVSVISDGANRFPTARFPHFGSRPSGKSRIERRRNIISPRRRTTGTAASSSGGRGPFSTRCTPLLRRSSAG